MGYLAAYVESRPFPGDPVPGEQSSTIKQKMYSRNALNVNLMKNLHQKKPGELFEIVHVQYTYYNKLI